MGGFQSSLSSFKLGKEESEVDCINKCRVKQQKKVEKQKQNDFVFVEKQKQEDFKKQQQAAQQSAQAYTSSRSQQVRQTQQPIQRQFKPGSYSSLGGGGKKVKKIKRKASKKRKLKKNKKKSFKK
jgi:hypothetical protein